MVALGCPTIYAKSGSADAHPAFNTDARQRGCGAGAVAGQLVRLTDAHRFRTIVVQSSPAARIDRYRTRIPQLFSLPLARLRAGRGTPATFSARRY